MSPHYFGPMAMRKDDETQVATPVGKVCRICDEAIADGDIGTVDQDGNAEHYECVMRLCIGSVGHLKKRCSCYGGDEEDPPGMTKRQAAQAAVRLWHQMPRDEALESE